MRDLAGNIGTGTIAVDSIDDETPIVTVAWWSPYLIDGDYYDVTQPAIKTNKTMTAKVVFSKTIEHAFSECITHLQMRMMFRFRMKRIM